MWRVHCGVVGALKFAAQLQAVGIHFVTRHLMVLIGVPFTMSHPTSLRNTVNIHCNECTNCLPTLLPFALLLPSLFLLDVHLIHLSNELLDGFIIIIIIKTSQGRQECI